MDKEHKDPETIDLKAPRLVQNMQTVWKEHQNTVFWVDIKLAQTEWVQKFVDKQKAPNQRKQTLIQFIEQGDLL